MNWTCLVYGAPMLGVIIWWVVDARKWFKGPKVGLVLCSCVVFQVAYTHYRSTSSIRCSGGMATSQETEMIHRAAIGKEIV